MTGSTRTAPPEDIAAVILAAGLSSRMGSLKPLLPFGDDILLAHVVSVARRAGAGPIHVVVGHGAEEVIPHVERLGVIAVLNPDYRSGMFGSIKAGLASLPDTVAGCLLMPVDIPLIRPTTLIRVMDEARRGLSPLVHPTFLGERAHPPFIGRSLFPDLLTSQDKGGAKAVLDRHEPEATEIAVFDEGSQRDMDDPEEYQAQRGILPTHYLPNLRECHALFEAANTPTETRRHGRAVAALATALTNDLARLDHPLDIGLVQAAALLHDIAKGHPHHASLGAERVRAAGFPALTDIIAHHMSLPEGHNALDETAVVYLADKLIIGEAPVSLEDRFAPALTRFAQNPAALEGVQRRLSDARAIVRAMGDLGVFPPLAPPTLLTMREAVS
ncbi:MAG: NTP transferase domain-containing protein [Rhodospirillum sp.]|nr:NTP transferase domain-containing protein [Rhodospirillum sp.]MCF8489231.1 NTP transferase domain-containing protein [Rhodospirillum sp.]MCF8500532.1 NTP transferase domain-containing protein [Rhodospirillum sp.]